MSDCHVSTDPIPSPVSYGEDYFEHIYAEKPDPWDLATSSYEIEKYDRTVSVLTRACYESALELGCSIGVLTRRLASRCDKLLAVDVSHRALAQAMHRCADLANVTFEKRDLAVSFPTGPFELIVVSELGYYFAEHAFRELATNVLRALAPHGTILLVHYTGPTDFPLPADAVHSLFKTLSGKRLRLQTAHVGPRYRLELLECTGNP